MEKETKGVPMGVTALSALSTTVTSSPNNESTKLSFGDTKLAVLWFQFDPSLTCLVSSFKVMIFVPPGDVYHAARVHKTPSNVNS